MATFNFALHSKEDTAPSPLMPNGWTALFYPINADTFASLNISLNQQQGWLTVANAPDGGTGAFYDLKGSFNNFGGFPVSYQMNMDCLPGPGVDVNAGFLSMAPYRNSTLVFGNQAGFITGNYPASFSMGSSGGAAPYSLSIRPGTQTYSKSDPKFSVAYGIYDCAGTWNTQSLRSVCSINATYSYSYNNTGNLSLAGTETQTLQPYTATGYVAMNDGSGTVSTITDTNGTIVITTHTEANDAAALAFVQGKFGGAIPNGQPGFLQVSVTQTYSDVLNITSANDGIFDWATLPQEPLARVTWSGLSVVSDMSTQALYTISTS